MIDLHTTTTWENMEHVMCSSADVGENEDDWCKDATSTISATFSQSPRSISRLLCKCQPSTPATAQPMDTTVISEESALLSKVSWIASETLIKHYNNLPVIWKDRL